MTYQPPFSITEHAVRRVAEIAADVEHLALRLEGEEGLRLRKANRIRSIHSTLAIEANSLSLEEVTAILEGKRVVAQANEIREVENAERAYAGLAEYSPYEREDLLLAHGRMMEGLTQDAGKFRSRGVGVFSGEAVVHIAPPADRVPALVQDLLEWAKTSTLHELIKGAVFHYEFEFIHPFSDGNGRMGRLWHTLLLGQWNPVFFHLPLESIVYRHQAEYYQAINQATQAVDSAVFIEFMLDRIAESVAEFV